MYPGDYPRTKPKLKEVLNKEWYEKNAKVTTCLGCAGKKDLFAIASCQHQYCSGAYKKYLTNPLTRDLTIGCVLCENYPQIFSIIKMTHPFNKFYTDNDGPHATLYYFNRNLEKCCTMGRVKHMLTPADYFEDASYDPETRTFQD